MGTNYKVTTHAIYKKYNKMIQQVYNDACIPNAQVICLDNC